MKDESGNKARIKHIIDAISDIEVFLTNIDINSFLKNKEKQFAVERLLEIIGEASNHISEEILYHPTNVTPWRKIIATRNLIAHEYFRINYEIIFQIATKEIIPLKQEIENILKELEK